MVDTFITLLVLMKSLCEEGDEETANESLSRYLEVTSIIVVRLLRLNVKDLQKKLPFSSLQSVIVFLDLFVRQAGLNKSQLDKVTPYALMRSLYHDIYLAEVEA